MEKQDYLKFKELDDARWELIPDMESDNVRTVRDAVARVRVLVKDMEQDVSWLRGHPTARKWVNELTHNAEQAVRRLGNEPEWKLLDAVCGNDSQKISQKSFQDLAPLFLGKPQKGGNLGARSDSQSGGNDFQENSKN